VRRFHKKTQNDSEVKRIGLVAQDLELVFPELVSESLHEATNITYKMINYAGLVVPLIKAIQEQQTQIEQLTQRIKALEGK